LDLGELVKKKRLEKGLSLRQLSKISGVSLGRLGDIERGDTKNPKLKTLQKIAEALEIPSDQIIKP